MAASTSRATSPHVEPFPPLDPGLSTPRSIPSSTLPLPIGPVRNIPADTTTNHHLSPRTPVFSNPAYTSTSPSKLAGLTRSPRVSPVPLTGQTAMADLKRHKQQQQQQQSPQQQHQEQDRTLGNDARHTSPNPAVKTMHDLMGGGGISRPSDAPAPAKLSEPLRKAAEKIHITDDTSQTDNSLQVSPTSMTSFGSLESVGPNTAMTSTADSSAGGDHRHYVAEPSQMGEGEGRYTGSNGHLNTGEEEVNKAFSYPGPPPRTASAEGARGMSFPGFGQSSPASPPASASKRHKCPYCATDFTRHHNLKSHLLTHSQEKPYECHTCQARFRRLHDLKRHTKLHTGERPHTCDKCGRRFARGDALARHNKGPGGCAGRRTSFTGDDDYGPDANGEGMDGVEYTGNDDDDNNQEPSARRVSEPLSRKRAHVDTLDDTSQDLYRQHSSTYPPAPVRQHASSISGTNMGPPPVIYAASGNTSAPPRDPANRHSPAGVPYYGGSSTSAGATNNGSGQVLDQRSMIESPKPLSPGQPIDSHRLSVGDASMSSNRHRSPSLTTQFQQAHFGRGNGGRTPPQAPMPFPSATPVLPPLQHHGHQQPARGPLASSTATSHPPQPSSSSSSHPLQARGLGSTQSLADGSSGGDIWGYVRSLEQRFSRMQDEYELRISRLQEELITLRGQVSAAAASQYAAGPSTDSMSGVTRY